MPKPHYLIPLLIIVVLTAAAIVWQADPAPKEQGASAGGRLNVSSQGSYMNTNVQGASLQQAAPPENSATSSDTNPQKAMPNYCQAGEQPIVDGCVSQ